MKLRSWRHNLTAIVGGGVLLFLCVPVFVDMNQERLNEALVSAVRSNDSSQVRSLLKSGADANARASATSRPSLQSIIANIEARLHGKAHKVEPPSSVLVLACNIRSNDQKYGPSGLVPANHEILQALLNHGADPNSLPVAEQNSPLAAQVAAEDAYNVELLLKRGANPNMPDVDRACFDAVLSGNPECARLLVHYGMHLNFAFVDAMKSLKVHLSLAEELLKHGADINAQDYNGQTALIVAADQDTSTVVEYLLRHHARASIRDHSGWMALDFAIRRSENRNVEPEPKADIARIVRLLTAQEKRECPTGKYPRSRKPLTGFQELMERGISP